LQSQVGRQGSDRMGSNVGSRRHSKVAEADKAVTGGAVMQGQASIAESGRQVRQ
jgi:hypothetical protein